MTPEPDGHDTQERKKDLLLGAIESEPSARESWLQSACGGDELLLADVRRLLATHESAGGFLEDPTREGIPDRAHTDATDLPGTRIGPYEIIEQIGEGGFGVVYRARQLAPVRRDVALKVLRWTAASEQVLARFALERQALAALDHPNVAQIHDAGKTIDGRPYFVMEWIDGATVVEHCDHRRMSIDQRIALFVSVCRAVQFAHEKGIVHRDLKASNVLVTVRSGVSIPKVIDFGIAKASQPNDASSAVMTEAGMLLGSLESMSPEQANRGVIACDTRGDVYSLGLLLYELLCGTRAFDFSDRINLGLSEILERIIHFDPVAPSRTLRDDVSPAEHKAADRGGTARQIARQLRGDLDRIVARALEKDRDRRYASVEALATDLERYLRREPIQAGPPGIGYRLGKLVRRHRAASALVVTIVVLMVAGTVSLAWQAERLARARDRAEMRARLASSEANALRSAALSGADEYVENLVRARSLALADPDQTPAEHALRDANAIQILDLLEDMGESTPSARALRRRLEADAILALSSAPVDASTLRTLDLLRDRIPNADTTDVEALLRLDVDLSTRASAIDPARGRQARIRLAMWLLRRARQDLELERFEDARSRAVESLQTWTAFHPDRLGQVIDASAVLGRALVALDRFEEALPLLERSQLERASVSTAMSLVAALRRSDREDEARDLERSIPVLDTREMGPVVMPPAIVGCDLGFSTAFGKRSVWTFGDTFTRHGDRATHVTDNSWASADPTRYPPTLRLHFALSEDQTPLALLQPSDEEQRSEPTPGAKRAYALWPEAIVALPDRAVQLVSYEKVRLGPAGGLDLEHIGIGWARWTHPDSSATRLLLRPGTDEPTLLFAAPEPPFGHGAFVHEDTLYAFALACADLRCGARLGRAPISSWSDRSRWTFFAGDDHWSSDWRDAIEVMDAASQLSVFYRAPWGRFVAVYGTPLEGAIELRTAETPEGPWSAPWRVHETVDPPSLEDWNYGVVVHRELARDGGAHEFLTYYRPLGGLTGELRMVEWTWADSVAGDSGKWFTPD